MAACEQSDVEGTAEAGKQRKRWLQKWTHWYAACGISYSIHPLTPISTISYVYCCKFINGKSATPFGSLSNTMAVGKNKYLRKAAKNEPGTKWLTHFLRKIGMT